MLKKIVVLVGSLLGLSTPAFADVDACSTFADLTTKSKPNTFVGYGLGDTPAQAEQNAKTALASNIRQKISATSTVVEDTKNASLEASSKSVVSEILIGAQVIRRCSGQGNFSAVVSLDKSTFLSSIETRLSSQISQAQKLEKDISSAKGSEPLARAVDVAKKFLANTQSHFQDDLNVCLVYEGCQRMKNQNMNVLDNLADLVSKNADKDQYILIIKGNITEKFKDNIISLLENDSIHTMSADETTDSGNSRRIQATCNVNKGTQILGGNRVIETRCVVEGFSGKQKMFRNVYSCKAMGDNSISPDDASDSCQGRLLKE
jgi:hypothetical protein